MQLSVNEAIMVRLALAIFLLDSKAKLEVANAKSLEPEGEMLRSSIKEAEEIQEKVDAFLEHLG